MSNIIFYAGVGSQQTPESVCERMTKFAQDMEKLGLFMRSGGARGADTAFGKGVSSNAMKKIYRPEHATPEALELAATIHPAWHRCDEYVRKLHARNCFQVLGGDLRTPSAFVACWTKDGGPTGGTGQAIRLATRHKIPVFNFFVPGAEERCRLYAEKLLKELVTF
jgi:hypothetical protein